MKSIIVWDIPTRLFHWLFALSFTIAFITAEFESWIAVHVFAGLVMFGLLAYRLIWGIIGSRYARFSSFLFAPGAATKYLFDSLQGKSERYIGHNPAGSWAVYLMLLLGLGISVSGLPLLSGGDLWEEVHEVLSYGALTVVVVHITGVVVSSLLHRENLPRAMVTGRKEGEESQGIRSSRPISAIVLLVLLAAFSISYWTGWDSQSQTIKLPFIDQPLSLAENGEGDEHEEDDD